MALFVISVVKVGKNFKECQFIYSWAFLTGSFVWDDLLIFSVFHAGSAFLAYFRDELRLWVLLFLVFWLVRSSGEMLYFFLQQFIEPKHSPHFISRHFSSMRKIFGDISEQKCFIILQVFFQIIMVTSMTGLILLLMNWRSLG